jgi:excisionase family DNA binding protein
MPKKPVKPQVATVAPEPRYLTIKGAAAYLSITVWCVRELIWARKVSHARLGNRYVIDKQALDKFMQEQMVCARS